MAKKTAKKKAQTKNYNKEITKLLLEFLALAVTLSGCMIVLDANKKQVRKSVLGAMTQEEEVYQMTREEGCWDKYYKACENPATNGCVAVMKECSDVLKSEE